MGKYNDLMTDTEDLEFGTGNSEFRMDDNVLALEERLFQQMDDLKKIPTETQEDALTAVTNTVMALRERAREQGCTDKANFLTEYLYDIRIRLLTKFKEFFGIDAASNAFGSTEGSGADFADLVQAFYSFLVINRKEGLANYIVKSILKHKKEFINTYKSKSSRKNIGAQKKYTGATDTGLLVLLDCLEDVVNDVIEGTTASTDFYKELEVYCADNEDEWQNAILLDKLELVVLPTAFDSLIKSVNDQSNIEAKHLITLSVYQQLSEIAIKNQ